MFSPQTRSFPFQAAKPQPFSPAFQTSAGFVSQSNKSTGPELNITAPTFQPGAGFGNAAFATGEFSFGMPNPKPQSFQPSPADASHVTSLVDAPNASNRIFSNIDYNDIVKPAKNSKAIPIVAPEHMSNSLDEEDPEDADGRITQSDARQKRARRFGDDGDEVPRFASPTLLLEQKPSAISEPDNALKIPDIVSVTDEDEDVSFAEVEHSEDDTDFAEGLAPPELEHRESDGNGLGVSATDDTPMPTPGNTGDPIDSSYHEGYLPLEASSPARASDVNEEEGEEENDEPAEPATHKHRSTLSATAKPFVFNPGSLGSMDYSHVPHSSTDFHEDGVKESQLGEPSISSPFSHSPTTTFRPGDEGVQGQHQKVLSSATENQDDSLQPSFNEIDE
ncbi:hypothetical protein LTS18_013637, partial [Coniosporium uncinatum]